MLSDGEIGFGDVQEMGTVLSELPQLRACMATQLFRLATSREPDDADASSMAPVQDALSEGGGDIRQAITRLVMSESFRTRRGD